MSRSREICPRCGDPVDPDGGRSDPAGPASASATEEARTGTGTATRGHGGDGGRDPDSALCDACYFESFDLVDAPDRVEVRVCSACGAVRRGNRWTDVGADEYADVAVAEVSEALGVHVDADSVAWTVAPEQVDETTIRVHCEFSGVVRGTAVTETAVVPVRISRGTCDRCGRIAGGSYAGVVQVRADDRRPTPRERERAEAIAREVVAEMEATGDRDAFVTEVTEVDGGLNLRLSTNKIGLKVARRIVDELGGTYSDSERLVTEDEDGNEVYRVTYAVRLPRYRPGEVIDPEDGDGPVLVRSVRGNLKGIRLATGEDYEAAFEDGDAPEARRLGERADAVETTLVTVEDDHAVQVLDPETYEAKTIARPDYLDPDADEVPVLKSRAGLHVVPREGRSTAEE